MEPDHQEIVEQMGVDLLGTTPHELLFEAADRFADSSFDFSLRLGDRFGHVTCFTSEAVKRNFIS